MNDIVSKNVARLKRAVEQGKIQALEQVWSPADTDLDTRYRLRTNDGQLKLLFHREVAGFLAGLDVTE